MGHIKCRLDRTLGSEGWMAHWGPRGKLDVPFDVQRIGRYSTVLEPSSCLVPAGVFDVLVKP